jgi:tRNA A-37 threonylcarbamoyl transferase component Bud32
MIRSRESGIPAPAVLLVDYDKSRIYMEYLSDAITLRDHIYQTQDQGLSFLLTDIISVGLE